MTILPTTKVKKLRKDEKRADDWSAAQSLSSSQVHRAPSSVSHHHSHSLSHPLPPPSLPHLPHPHSSISPGPPRKVARKAPPPSAATSVPSSSLPAAAASAASATPHPQPALASPRGADKKTEGEKDGPNSDDEYDRGFRDEEMERSFENSLREKRGLEIKKTVGDGACLFRAVSHQIYGDEEMHGEVRRLCMDYMEKNREHFEQFITEDFGAYITRKRRLTVHGNHVELQAISEIFNRPIEIYEYNLNPINVFHPKSSSGMGGASSSSDGPSNEKREKEEEEMNAPIRMSYHGSTHYNAVIDPRVATVGVGLGLPSFDPGMADRQLIEDAITKSEMHQIEQAMLKDKMSMTDWERTEEDLKDQALRESYMEYARSMEAASNEPSTSRYLPPSLPPLPSTRRPSVPSSPQPCSSRHVDVHERPPSAGSRGATPSTSAAAAAAPSASAAAAAKPAAGPSGSGSLYEELLMAEAIDWNDESSYDASLAEALLMSQQSFFTECIRRPEDEEGEGEK